MMNVSSRSAGISPISVCDAERIILAAARRMRSEVCNLGDALGRELREDLIADRDFPPFDRVCMDGVAVRYDEFQAGRRSFRVAGTQAAGVPRLTLTDSQGCFEVMTGALLPAGTDCVVRSEDIAHTDDEVVLHHGVTLEQFQNVHPQGSDYSKGAVLVRAGRVIDPPILAICASIGKMAVTVAAEPRISVIATGDELVPVLEEPQPHQIRMSNPYAVQATLHARGYHRVDIQHMPDDRATIVERLENAIAKNDVVITSGGVSAGRFDFVPGVLEDLGVKKLIHGVLQRPGFPLWFGVSDRGTAIFGLPGNPVPALISTIRYVLPFLQLVRTGKVGEREEAVLSEDYEFGPELTLFLPVAVGKKEGGYPSVIPRPVGGSGDFAHLAESDGFIELPSDRKRFESGSCWPFYRWGQP